MGVEVSPTGRSLLAVVGVAAFALIAVYTSGGLLTLGLLAITIAVILYVAWVVFVRATRRLTGA